MKRTILTLALGSLVVATGCNLLPGGGGGTGGTIEGRWILSSYDANGTSTPVPAGVTVTAAFAAGTIAGTGGCNTYSGPYTVDGAKIDIGQLRTTLKACVGPEADVETAYFAALENVATFTATTDALTLFDSSGKTLLVYKAGPANPLVGSWVVTGYNNGNQAVVSPAAGTELTAVFAEDGALSGNAGCNAYNGDYKLEGETLAIGPLATTRKACEGSVMTQEEQFLAALQGATGYRVEGANITLTSADGSNAVTLAPAS